MYSNPEKGAALAVAESARNIVCSGGTPLGVTNCLNFGNPYNPEVYYQFAHAIKGMGDACRAFGLPITGGNVSFYNQSEDGPVFPTPTIGMVGAMESLETMKMGMAFQEEELEIYLLGKVVEDLGSSAYLYNLLNVYHSPAPYINLEEEVLLQQLILVLIQDKLIESAHDISDGGLITCLLESAFVNEIGFSIECPGGIRKDAFLFGEAGGRVVVSVNKNHREAFEAKLKDAEVDALYLGQTGGIIAKVDEEEVGTIRELREVYDGALPAYMRT